MAADSSAQPDERQIVLRVLRGVSPPQAVAEAGYHLSRTASSWHLERSRGASSAERTRCAASTADVASGLLANSSDSERLGAWAFLVHALADGRYADGPDGALLRDAVWRAPFGLRPTPEALAAARRLAGAEPA